MCDSYLQNGREEERLRISEWLLACGQGDLARRIHDGEHLRYGFPLIAAENQVVHEGDGFPDPPDPGMSDEGQEADREAAHHDA